MTNGKFPSGWDEERVQMVGRRCACPTLRGYRSGVEPWSASRVSVLCGAPESAGFSCDRRAAIRVASCGWNWSRA